MPLTNACDACRLRKVKCTWANNSAAACDFCSSISIPCHTAPRQRQRAKTTARAKTVPKTPARPQSSSTIAASSNPTTRPSSPPWRQRTIKTDGQQGARLLGVAGLSRQALDSCVDTFFSSIGQVFSLSQSQAVFCRRIRVQLYYSSGLDIPAELADIAHDPASRLLILAVACRGSFFGPYSYLADDLYAHCARILSESFDAVSTDYLDAIESILLLSELTIQPRNGSATRLDPLGKGTVVDLALYHRLHIAPPPTSPDFQRRLALFTRIWAHDAIRSASAHTCYRITDDDFGWPMPSSAEDVPYVALTLATREICATLLSPRAKGLGLSNEAVQNAVVTLQGLRARMKVDIGTLRACLAPGVTPESDPHLFPLNAGVPLKPMEQLFMMSTHDWLHIVVWAAVQESLERHPDRLSTSTMVNVESAAVAACEDMAILTQISTTHGLHARGPRSIRNHMAAFALFLVRVFTSIASPTVEQSSRYFALAETLNSGVRSASYYPDSDTLANTLRMALYRATRISSKDAARVAERGLEGLPLDAPPGAAPQPPLEHAVADPAASSIANDFSQLHHDEDVISLSSISPQNAGTPMFSEPLRRASDEFTPRSMSLSLDWGELMDTLKDCGFEMPLGPL